MLARSAGVLPLAAQLMLELREAEDALKQQEVVGDSGDAVEMDVEVGVEAEVEDSIQVNTVDRARYSGQGIILPAATREKDGDRDAKWCRVSHSGVAAGTVISSASGRQLAGDGPRHAWICPASG